MHSRELLRVFTTPLLIVPVAGSALAAAGSCTLDVFPCFSPSRLEEIYAPATADLTRTPRHSLEFRTAPPSISSSRR